MRGREKRMRGNKVRLRKTERREKYELNVMKIKG